MSDCPEMKILSDLADTFKRQENMAARLALHFQRDLMSQDWKFILRTVQKIDINDLIQIAIEYWKGKVTKTK